VNALSSLFEQVGEELLSSPEDLESGGVKGGRLGTIQSRMKPNERGEEGREGSKRDGPKMDIQLRDEDNEGRHSQYSFLRTP
jgi:hypothetical protein